MIKIDSGKDYNEDRRRGMSEVSGIYFLKGNVHVSLRVQERFEYGGGIASIISLTPEY